MNRLIGILLSLLVASAVSAQSLAEIARKEKERRKNLKSAGSQSYDDADLRGSEGPMTQVTGGPGAESEGEPEESSTEGSGEEQDPAQTEAYWRERLQAIDGRIRNLEARLAGPELTSNPRGERERQSVERDLAQARADRRALVDEARRAGVPPGWLR